MAEKQGKLQSAIDLNRRMAYSYTIAGYQLKYLGQQILNFSKSATDTFADFDSHYAGLLVLPF